MSRKKLKIGDKVIIRTKYFSPFDEMSGTIVAKACWGENSSVIEIDEEWSVNSNQVFPNKELKLIK